MSERAVEERAACRRGARRSGSAHKSAHGGGARGGNVNARWAGPGLLARSAPADRLSHGARAPGGGPGGTCSPWEGGSCQVSADFSIEGRVRRAG